MKGIRTLFTKMSRIKEKIRLWAFYRRFPMDNCVGVKMKPFSKDYLDLVTIAFNNPEMIKYQYRLLKKFVTDTYVYTVADNSTDGMSRLEIRAFCLKNGVPYIALPPSPYAPPSYSKSHGAALNYMYKNYIKPRAASSFGFLDHDIFPVSSVSPRSYLKSQPYYGMLQVYPFPQTSGGRLLYLWPGLAFFNSDYTHGKTLDFFPDYGGDTGARCFYSLYKPLLIDQEKEATFLFADEKRVNLWDGNDFQNDMYAYIGNDWLHAVNASDWRGADDFEKKENRMKEMLEQLLQK